MNFPFIVARQLRKQSTPTMMRFCGVEKRFLPQLQKPKKQITTLL